MTKEYIGNLSFFLKRDTHAHKTLKSTQVHNFPQFRDIPFWTKAKIGFWNQRLAWLSSAIKKPLFNYSKNLLYVQR